MTGLFDAFALWVLRAIANVMLLAGMAFFTAGLALQGFTDAWPVAAKFLAMLLQIGGVFVIAGAVAAYLSVTRRELLPNERGPAGAEGSALSGWMFGLAAVLGVIPFVLVAGLQPFLAEWSRLIGLMAQWDIWNGANANGSGLVLAPIAAALTAPFFELAAAALFVGISPMLLGLLLTRSRRFPRAYLVGAVLLSGLVVASVRGAAGAMATATALRPLIEGAPEARLLSNGFDRYEAFVTGPLPVLFGALCAYLVWAPAMILSPRARATFAGEERPPDIVSITRHPREAG